jgi:L-arabinose isomerase
MVYVVHFVVANNSIYKVFDQVEDALAFAESVELYYEGDFVIVVNAVSQEEVYYREV